MSVISIACRLAAKRSIVFTRAFSTSSCRRKDPWLLPNTPDLFPDLEQFSEVEAKLKRHIRNVRERKRYTFANSKNCEWCGETRGNLAQVLFVQAQPNFLIYFVRDQFGWFKDLGCLVGRANKAVDLMEDRATGEHMSNIEMIRRELGKWETGTRVGVGK